MSSTFMGRMTRRAVPSLLLAGLAVAPLPAIAADDPPPVEPTTTTTVTTEPGTTTTSPPATVPPATAPPDTAEAPTTVVASTTPPATDTPTTTVAATTTTTTATTTSTTTTTEPAVPAPEDLPASLGGRVVDEFGNPAYDIRVTAESPTSIESTWTDFDGSFHMSVTPETYVLRFDDWNGRFRTEWWQDALTADAATPIVAADGATLTFDVTVGPIPEGTASVSGVITDEVTGDPLPFVYVTLSGPEYSTTFTDEFGQYTFSGLDAGEYRLWFEDFSGRHLMEWWDDVSDPSLTTPIVLDDQEAFTADVALAPRPVGTISGIVTDDLTGMPLPFIQVVARGPDYAETYTDEFGQYVLGDLDVGSYELRFADGQRIYIDEWWDDVTDPSLATPVAVTDGTTLTADASLTRRPVGTIAGTVTDEETGAPLGGIRVHAFGPDSEWTYTDDLGQYSIDGLEAGSYQVRFEHDTGRYLAELWDNATDPSLATPIEVEADVTFTADAALTPRPVGTVTGTVTDEVTGEPLEGILVALSPGLQITSTDALGQYTFEQVDAGTHQVAFVDFNGVYTTEHWDNAPNDFEATPVVVEDDATFTADAALARRQVGAISGTVTSDLTGEPLPFITVHASGPESESTTTDEFGVYTLDGLDVGSYDVSFVDFHDGRHATEWWDNVSEPWQATPVVVENGATVAANASLALRPGVGTASISGTVTDSLGDPLPGVDVYVEGPSFSTTSTDENGRYTIADLPAGEYIVYFVQFYEYETEWWNDASSAADATPVVVADGAQVDGIDASLAKPGAAYISGRVTAADGSPISGIRVEGRPNWTGSSDVATTWADGTYSLEVTGGEYILEFSPPSGTPWIGEFYDDTTEVINAEPVVVAAGETRTGIDAQLARIGLISGRVTAGGQPVAGVSVRGSSGTSSIEGGTDGDGFFSIPVPNPGSYLLRFAPSEGNLRPEWYDDAAHVGDATTVLVGAGSTVAGIDADLSAGGSISGRITDSAGEPIAGTLVAGQDALSWRAAVTDVDGSYTLDGLQGDVVISAGFDQREFVGRYWPDAPTFELAGRVVVEGDVELTDYDIALPRRGTISGVVTGPGGPVANAVVWLHQPDGGGTTNFTDADGGYQFPQLTPGDYTVEFLDVPEEQLLGEFFDDARSLESATAVTVRGDDRVENVDAELSPAGTLTGRVTDVSGAPVPGVRLDLRGTLSGPDSVYTDAEGRYEARIRPGDGSVQVISEEYVQATHHYSGAVAGQTTTLDIVVDTGVSLSTTVIVPDDLTIVVAEISILTPAGDHLGGSWGWGEQAHFDHLPVGDVEVRSNLYLCRMSRCQSVTVTQVVELVDGPNLLDIVVPDRGAIRGRVTNDLGEPLADEHVGACTVVTNPSCLSARTDADGRYVIEGAFPGDYRVAAAGMFVTDVGSKLVAVGPGGEAVADFVVERPMTISGTVRTSSGSALESGVSIQAIDAATGEVVRVASPDAGGSFELDVPPRDAIFCAETVTGLGVIRECWDNAASVDDATLVEGTPGQSITGIDFTLGGPGVVGGLVASVGGDDVTLMWNPPIDTGGRVITDYVIQIDSGGGTWETYHDGISTSRSVTLSNLERGRSYRFRVAAVNVFGVGVASAPVSVEILPTVPGSPRNLTATRLTGGGPPRFVLTWDAPADDGGSDVLDYIVQRSPNGRTWTTIDDGTSAATSYTVTSAGGGQRFRVIAVNAAGIGPPSAVVKP